MILDASYDAKTIEELQAEFNQLASEMATCSDKRVAIFALIEKRKAEAKAASRVAQLTAIEKDALKRALEARGTPQ